MTPSFKDPANLIIGASNPCLLIYLLDESASMSDKFGNSNSSKATELCNAINGVIYELGLKCMRNGEIRNRFEIALFAYGDTEVKSGWQGSLAGKFVQTMTSILNNAISADDDTPVWISPQTNGGTPMRAAFENVKMLCEDWINYGRHKEDCHPPIIINVTDGEATDDDPNFTGIKQTVQSIQDMYTDWGYCIVLNIHISSRSSDRVLFPDRPISTDRVENLLFDISSQLTPAMIGQAKKEGYNLSNNARGYVFNGTGIDLVKFLNIGSTTFTGGDR